MTEERICASLIDMMEKVNFSDIKVSELINYTKISRSTFYFYFSSIPDVLDKMENDFINGISDEYTAISRISEHRQKNAPAEDLILPTITFVGNNLRLFRILCGSNGNPQFRTKLQDRIKRIANISFSHAAHISPARMALTCEFMASAQWAIYSWWATHENEITIAEMCSFVSDYLSSLNSFF